MRKLMLVVALFALIVGTAYGQSAFQDTGAQKTNTSKKANANPPLKTIAGTISEDGKSFTSDKDKSSWTLKNPEDVKGHEGHHVKLSAHVYADSKELHVMKVTMMGAKSAKKKSGS